MRAMIIRGYGGPEVFEQVDLPRPEPGAGEVLIRVRASSVNPVDYKIRNGRGAFLIPELPAILHGDCAGTVEAVGEGVSNFTPGDAVYSFSTGMAGKPGALAEYMVAPAHMIAKKPANLSFEEAAALPLVAVTCWHCLVDQADISPGHSLLVQGGTGGVGHVAVQLAKARGARVFATCGSPEKARLAESLGAEKAFDYRSETPEAMAEAAPGGQGYDFVFNTPGTPSINQSVIAARIEGTILDILGNFPTERGFQMKWLTFRSVFAARHILTGKDGAHIAHILREITRLAEEGKMRPLIDQRQFAFPQAGEAHQVAEHGSPTGKVVLTAEW